MQIIMNQVEIETAITDFVSRQINISTDQEITIELQATRGANGYTATLGIMPRVEAQALEERDERRAVLVKEFAALSLEQKAAVEPKAEPKPVAKATLGIAPKAKGLLLKAQAEAEVEAEAVEPEVATKAYTGEDDGADDEVENSMASSSREEEPPMNETVKTSDAPPPRSIFSKSKAG